MRVTAAVMPVWRWRWRWRRSIGSAKVELKASFPTYPHELASFGENRGDVTLGRYISLQTMLITVGNWQRMGSFPCLDGLVRFSGKSGALKILLCLRTPGFSQYQRDQNHGFKLVVWFMHERLIADCCIESKYGTKRAITKEIVTFDNCPESALNLL